MQTGQNQDEKSEKERAEMEANQAAAEKMDKNLEEQVNIHKRTQNELTQSEDTDNDASALSNNHEEGQSNDSVSIEEKNRRRLDLEQDEDFGNEQLNHQ